jgi:predicted RND superfamily exporter protein
MAHGRRGRALAFVADLGLRRPRFVLALLVLATLVCGAIVPGLGVSTSRTGLVSRDDPGQQRLFAFYETFGRPEFAVFVVAGAGPEERRAVVDALQSRLEAEPDLKDRVLGRLTPRVVAPLALLQKPDTLAQMRAELPPDASLADLVQGGVPRWLSSIESEIYRGLEGDDEEKAPEPAELREGFERLGTLATLLDDHLQGRDPLARVSDGSVELGQRGLDDAGYLVSDDGSFNLVSVFAELPSDEGREVQPIVERMRAIRDEVLAGAPEGVTADLTGMPALIVDELQIVQHGLMVSSVVTTIGIALLCLLLFRSVRQMIIALVPLLPGVVCTMAFIRLLYDDLNLVTSSFVAVLLGLGIDFSVHAIARYNEELRGGATPAAAVRVSLAHTGPGILTGALVTAAAFLTTMLTEFTAFAELGLVTAFGLIVIVAAMFLLMPVLLPSRKAVAASAPPEPPGIAHVPVLVRRGRSLFVFGGLVLGILGGVALFRIEWNPRYFDFLPQDTESARGLDRLEYDPIASPVFANFAAGGIEEARAMAEELRALDSVAAVQTPSDLLPPLGDAELAELRAGFEGAGADPDFSKLAELPLTAEALRADVVGVVDALDEVKAALAEAGQKQPALDTALADFKRLRDGLTDPSAEVDARVQGLHRELADLLAPAWTTARAVADRGHYLPSDLPELFRRRFASRDGQKAALFAVPAGQFWEKDVADRFAADAVAIYPDASGLAMIHVEHGEMIVIGFRRAALVAAILVVFMLALDFRSLRDALYALLPTALGWLWMAGGMVIFGLRFDVANIVSLPLVLGIGIAFGVHVMHRVREDDPKPGDPSPELPNLDTAVRGTGGAIAVAALTTIVGFAGLMTSDYGAMVSFGGVMVIGICTCLVATVFVLPAALLMLRRVR